ncbi:hypothetical protein HWB51_gp081 [Mycobacterium phage Cuke]|uniref:Uncharacterized protein n=1 Tax=Mycobacterium phage Cuke TaxID=2079417 RepID=A0A2L1IX17_9CAUD|nr:hypothetical protein HWB51_gp081 [Mycobacterium phage Cuke]AVD99731.1 hypothetical protein SEA_CUKE_115 [Mycobacterium phage Cuke]
MMEIKAKDTAVQRDCERASCKALGIKCIERRSGKECKKA